MPVELEPRPMWPSGWEESVMLFMYLGGTVGYPPFEPQRLDAT